MFKYESKFFKILEVVTAFFQLNIIWLLFCLPIITIFPAIVAMFCVIRQWILHKDYSVFRSFFQFFKENFKQSILLGIIGTVFVGLFFLDFTLMKNLGSFQYIITPVLFLLGLLVLFTSIFIFPTIANFNMSWKNAIKSSLFFSIRYFPTTLGAIICLALMVLILITWPITFIFIFSTCSFAIYLLCHRLFIKIQRVESTN